MKSLVGKILSSKIYRRPIFVVGGSRSGTSILLQALGKHPHILDTPGESPLITSMGGMVHLFEHTDSSTRAYYNASLRFPKEYLYNCIRRLSFEIACGPHWGARYLIGKLIENPWKLVKKSKWAAKTFPNEKVAKGLVELFPEAKFLYIIRNGMDAVCSMMKFHGFRELSFEENCRRWSNSFFTYDYMRLFPAALTMRHEDLVADPHAFFKGVFNFLDEEEDQNVLSYVTSTIVHPLDQPTQSGSPVKETFLSRSRSYQQWSHEQKKTFRDICGRAMAEAAYEVPF